MKEADEMTADTASNMPFYQKLAILMDNSGRKRYEIAEALGYDNPNVISMFKKGTTKVPMVKIPALADVLGIDRKWLFHLALRAYSPELLPVIEEVYGPIVTANERRLLDVVRKESEFRDIRLDADMEADMRQLMQKWRDRFDRKMLGGSSGAEGGTG